MSEMEIMDYEFGEICSNGGMIFFGHKNINKYISGMFTDKKRCSN